jgi:chromosome segregation ATPase
MLSSMLLNELQKQHRAMVEQKAATQRQIADLKASYEQERSKRTAFEQRLANLERTVIAQKKDRSVQAAFNK